MNNIIVDEKNPEKIKQVLRNGIKHYNYPFFGEYELKPFSMHIENQECDIIAGLSGFILEKHKTVRVEFVWVREDSRHQGLGAALLKRLDEYAISHNCYCIQASTMDFQGPKFYLKMGFQLLGTIPKWFCGHDEAFFEKILSGAS